MTPTLAYDRETDAAYLRFSAGSVVDSEEISPGLVIDLDAEGRIVALEILGAGERLPRDALAAA